MTLHFLNDVVMTLNQQKNENYVIIASLKSETIGKLINRIPGSRLLISSLPGSALRTLVESLGKCQQAFSKPCLVNLISKDTHLVFSIYWEWDLKYNCNTIHVQFIVYLKYNLDSYYASILILYY